MRFTAQEEYGLRCLLQMAREPAGFATIPEIAGKEGLTVAYVGKLMSVLRKAGLVTSTRGQNGGYQLARAPEEIDVRAILAALGGRLYSEDFCNHFSGQKEVCVHHDDCSIRTVWAVLDSAVQRALSRITLEDLLCPERDLEGRVRDHGQLVELVSAAEAPAGRR